MSEPHKESYTSWLRRYVGKRRIFHVGSLAAVRDEQGHVLVMRRSDNGEWDFPGGAMELGETLEQALVREVAEETGLLVEPTRLVGIYTSTEHNHTYPNGDQVQGWGALFECRVVNGSLQARDGEALDLAFIPPDQLEFSFPILEWMKADLLAGREEAAFESISPSPEPPVEYYAILRPHIGHAPLLLPGTAACIFDEQDRILLQKRSDFGIWGLPGGAQDLGESAAQAMVREVQEETGLHVEPVRLTGVYSNPAFGKTLTNGDQVQPIVACFEAKIIGGELGIDSPETLDLAYFAADDLPPMLDCCRVKAGDAFVGRQAAFFR